MADHEAAARAPPVAAAPPPPTPARPAAADEAKAALGDAVVYGFLSATFVGCAASIALLVARYALGGGRYPDAYAAAAAGARHVFLLALLAAEMLCPFAILVLVLRLGRRRPDPPEELLVVEGVHATVQVHGLEHPGARGGRRGQGTGYGLIPLVVFVVFWMFMLLGLLMQERWPATEKACCGQTVEEALISDIGSFTCSVMVISVFIPLPHVLIQLRKMPR